MNFLRTKFSIKTEERDIQLKKPFETIHLFSEIALQRHREKTLNIFILAWFKSVLNLFKKRVKYFNISYFKRHTI